MLIVRCRLYCIIVACYNCHVIIKLLIPVTALKANPIRSRNVLIPTAVYRSDDVRLYSLW